MLVSHPKKNAEESSYGSSYTMAFCHVGLYITGIECIICPMAAIGRFLLHAVTGVEVPVLANERLFTKVNFQRDEGLKTARSGTQYLRFVLSDR